MPLRFVLLLSLLAPAALLGGEGRNLDPVPRLDPADAKVQRWAVVIGISAYQDPKIARLRYAEADAKAFAAFLQSPQGGSQPADRLRLLVDADATLEAVRTALADFLKQAQEDDIVLIFFAGHGAPEPGRADTAYLLCHDTKVDRLYATAFPMDEMRTILQKRIFARRVLVIADACHAGGIATAGLRADTKTASQVTTRVLQAIGKESQPGALPKGAPGRAILMSCAEGELSQEDARWGGGHGVFTHFLLDGLKGRAADKNADGLLDLQELYDYVRPEVS